MHYKNCLKNMKSDDLFLVSLYSDYNYNSWFSIVGTHGISIRYTSESTGFLSVTRRNHGISIRYTSESTVFLSVTRRNPRDFYPLHVGTTGFLSVTRHERSVMDRNPVGSDDVDSVDIYSWVEISKMFISFSIQSRIVYICCIN